ncbi:MAG: hypothetical protein HC880_09800 [Bacteroidia bacterium]|nr:hypothetical protein [Bacteroidia bacterium]
MQTLSIEPTIQTSHNPFPGLRPFREEESHLYFGRYKQVSEVKDKLMNHRFVAVIGTSGIGKSSFIHCGLFPALRNEAQNESGREWKIYQLRPAESPLQNLIQAIHPEALSQMSLVDQEGNLNAGLRENPQSLVEIIKSQESDQNFTANHLIFVDQFEELFRFKEMSDHHSEESATFVNLLIEAIKNPDVPVYVVLTMRSDFIGNCSQYPKLTNSINTSQFLIPYMTRSERRDAIVEPIKVAGGHIDDDLVTTILNDIGDSPDQLPIMQHALMRTWDDWQKYQTRDPQMARRHYEAIGGVKEALSVHANEAFYELDKEQQSICKKVFQAITEITEEGKQVRRPSQLGEVAEIVGTDINQVARVVDHFRRADRGLLMPPPEFPLHSSSIMDISHESLIRIWSTLRNGWRKKPIR